MLLDLLSQYLGDVAIDVRKLEDAKIERYEEDILAANRANLRIRIRFLSGYLLELNEAAIVGSLPGNIGVWVRFRTRRVNHKGRWEKSALKKPENRLRTKYPAFPAE